MKRYFKGDTVEIVTAEYKSMQDIPYHKVAYETAQGSLLAAFIGLRFNVDYISYDGSLKSELINSYIDVHCVILYKRPLKNWFKYYATKIIEIKDNPN